MGLMALSLVTVAGHVRDVLSSNSGVLHLQRQQGWNGMLVEGEGPPSVVVSHGADSPRVALGKDTDAQ